MSHTQDLPNGLVLDGIYEILEILGSGGFGKTYRVLDRNLNRELAIKEFFPGDYAVRDGFTVRPIADVKTQTFEMGLERFIREGRHLAKLAEFGNRNIVKIHRSFDGNGTSYIVLEYIEGRDLADKFTELGRPFTQDEADQFAIPMLKALEQIHEVKLLHRDVQPKNIRIRSSDGSPVLLDFGTAKSLRPEDRNQRTDVIVAHGYAPFESYAHEGKSQGPCTDIYGLAAVLYRALAGAAPPPSPDRLTNDHMVPAASLGLQGFREDFLKAVDWGLEVMPGKRPQTIAEWRAQLLRGRVGTTTSPKVIEPPTERMPPATTPPRRDATRVAMALGGLLIVGGALIMGAVTMNWVGPSRVSLATAEPPAQTPAESRRQQERLEIEERRLQAERQAEQERREREADLARKENERLENERRAREAQTQAELNRRAEEAKQIALKQAREAEEARKLVEVRRAEERIRKTAAEKARLENEAKIAAAKDAEQKAKMQAIEQARIEENARRQAAIEQADKEAKAKAEEARIAQEEARKAEEERKLAEARAKARDEERARQAQIDLRGRARKIAFAAPGRASKAAEEQTRRLNARRIAMMAPSRAAPRPQPQLPPQYKTVQRPAAARYQPAAQAPVRPQRQYRDFAPGTKPFRGGGGGGGGGSAPPVTGIGG